MGLLSFAAIVVPMCIVLLNESIGDAIVDVIIPGIYAGLIIGGAKLFAISLLALLLPICVVFGALCYYAFVYRPSVESSRNRKEEMRRILMQDIVQNARGTRRLKSDKTSVSAWSCYRCAIGYIKRVGTIVKHGFYDCITWLSCGEVRSRNPRERIVQRDWCNINKPPSHQATVPNRRTECRQIPCPKVNTYDALFLPPKRISDMMTSSTQWQALYLNKQKGCVTENPDSTTSIDPLEQPVVFTLDSNNKATRTVIPLIILDPHELLARLWLRIADLPKMTPAVATMVTPEKLVSEMRSVLELFYPDGLPMSEEENAEACEMLRSWCDERLAQQQVEEQQRGVIFANNKKEEERVSYRAFEMWFLSDLMISFRSNIHERILSRALQLAPIIERRRLHSVGSAVSNRDLMRLRTPTQSFRQSPINHEVYAKTQWPSEPLIREDSWNRTGEDSELFDSRPFSIFDDWTYGDNPDSTSRKSSRY